MKLCTTCGTAGPTKRVMKGSLLMEVVLWCFFLVPGLIYSIWRHANVYQGCAACGAATMIPLESPVAKKLGYTAPSEARTPISPKKAWGIVLAIAAALVLAAIMSR